MFNKYDSLFSRHKITIDKLTCLENQSELVKSDKYL